MPGCRTSGRCLLSLCLKPARRLRKLQLLLPPKWLRFPAANNHPSAVAIPGWDFVETIASTFLFYSQAGVDFRKASGPVPAGAMTLLNSLDYPSFHAQYSLESIFDLVYCALRSRVEPEWNLPESFASCNYRSIT